MGIFKIENNINIIVTIIRIIFGMVFLFSGIIKFIDLNAFEIALGKFKLLSESQHYILVYAIPIAELLLGLFLLLNIKTYITSQIITFMVALFTAVIIAKIYEGEEISCGCFGNLTEDVIDYKTVLRNLILIMIGITLTSFYYSKKFINNSQIEYQEIKRAWFDNFKKTSHVMVFFFLCIITIIFGFQNRELKNRIMLLTIDRDTLKKNEIVKPFSVKNMNGETISISYDDMGNTKTIIYLLSFECEPCKLNLTHWMNLTDLTRNEDIRIIAITSDSLSTTIKFIQDNKCNFDIYSAMDKEFKINYKAFITPQTILIDENRKVVNVWKGVLDDGKIDEIIKEI